MRRAIRQLICRHPFTAHLTRFKKAHELRFRVCLRCGKEARL